MLVLTICSSNYLAHARTLGDSLTQHNPECRFVIGLVDQLPPALEPAFWHPYELIPVESLAIPGFSEMAGRYGIIELNTAVKPFYIDYLYRRDAGVQKVVYLDPDIYVTGSLQAVERKLDEYSIIVTPHRCIHNDTEEQIVHERAMIRNGIYNLGFLATSRTSETMAFLKWWQARLRTLCYLRLEEGLFVDQYWVTLASVYFDGMHVERNLGYNMCYWNRVERSLSQQDGRYLVNGEHELIFYHFSSYSPLKPELLATRGRVMLADRPDLKPLFDEYRSKLLANRYVELSSKECHYLPRKQESIFTRAARWICIRWLTMLPLAIQRSLNHAAHFIGRHTAKWQLRKEWSTPFHQSTCGCSEHAKCGRKDDGKT